MNLVLWLLTSSGISYTAKLVFNDEWVAHRLSKQGIAHEIIPRHWYPLNTSCDIDASHMPMSKRYNTSLHECDGFKYTVVVPPQGIRYFDFDTAKHDLYALALFDTVESANQFSVLDSATSHGKLFIPVGMVAEVWREPDSIQLSWHSV